MSEQVPEIEACYEAAKYGRWERLLFEWQKTPSIAHACSRYRNESSGWTFLHQAAYWGNEAACRRLIRIGASPSAISRDGQNPADVAEARRFAALAKLLRHATQGADSLWEAPKDHPGVLASSWLWNEAEERRASATMRVAYGGGVVTIRAGSRFFVDSFERVLVGWHGTYDPPCGMDGESMI